MRKFKIVLPEELLPEMTRATRPKGLSFKVKPMQIEIVTITIKFERQQTSDIDDLEAEILQLIKDYYGTDE